MVLKLFDRKRDLALIATRKAITKRIGVINYNPSKHAGPGTLVAAMGFPDSDTLSQTVGNIKRVEGGYLIFDKKIAPGSSGGPLVDKFGRMIGLSQKTFEDESFVMPFDSLSTTVDGWLKEIRPMQFWQRQKYGNFGQRMIYDWKFVATELSLVGGATYLILKPPVPEDLPGPPGTPGSTANKK